MMLERRTHHLAALTLALLMALTPVALADVPVDSEVSPDRINWGKVLGYAECGVGIYASVVTGGSTAVWAVLICARVFIEQED